MEGEAPTLIAPAMAGQTKQLCALVASHMLPWQAYK
jgi:hypothetical protein